MERIPIRGSEIDVWDMLMYKDVNKGKESYWLIFDDYHYHAITNARGFFYLLNTSAIRAFSASGVRLNSKATTAKQ